MVKTNKTPESKRTAKKPSKRQQPNKKITPEVIGLIVFASIVVIAGLIVLIAFLTDYIKMNNLEHKLASETVSSRTQQKPSSDTAHQNKINLLLSSGAIDAGAPILSQYTDKCMLAGDVAGWVYTDWQQVCLFTYVDYLPTTLSKEQAASQLTTLPTVVEEFGEVDTSKFRDNCELLRLRYSPTLRYFNNNSPGDRCTFDGIAKGNVGDIIKESDGESFILKSFTPEEIDRTKAYIRVESRTEYYRSQKLGCKPIMCGAPIESPFSAFK